MAVTERPGGGGVTRALGTFLGACGSVVFGTSVVFSLVFPDASSWLTLGPISVSLLAMAGWLALSYKKLTESLSQRSGVYVAISLGSALAVLAVLVGVNVALVNNPVSWDVSARGVHSLSEQTRKVLAKLDAPVRVVDFYKLGTPEALKLDALLESYQRESDHIVHERYSPTRDLKEVEAYGATADGPKVFVVMNWEDNKKATIARFSIDMTQVNHEQELTNAIMKVAQSDRPRIYMLTGHGEATSTGDSDVDYKQSVDDLVNEGYEVAPLNLVERRRIPDDAAAVIVAGPRLTLLPPEVAELSRYLAEGGPLAVFLEPGQSHGLGVLLGSYGVQVNDDLVIDLSPFGTMFGGGPDTATSTEFADHPITAKLAGSTIVMPRSRSLSINPGAQATPVALVKTGLRAWGETDEVAGDTEVGWNEGEVKGPVTLAVVAEAFDQEKQEAGARLVVTGDASFASNKFRGLAANRNLFLNVVGWMTAQDDKVAIRPRTRGANQIVLSPGQREGIAFFVLYLLPVLLLSVGLGIWLVRKQR